MTKDIKFEIGDTITFKAKTYYQYRKATRKVVGIDISGCPLVVYEGWTNFLVKLDEIIEVKKK